MSETELIGESKLFDEKIKNINSAFFSALDDFKKYYVYFHKNPEVNEFQNYYANSKGQLQSIGKDLFLTTNNIDKYIEDLNYSMNNISKKLETEKNKNIKMSDLVLNLENTQNGSEILISDSKKQYNIQYYKNIELFFGILIIGGVLATLKKS
jgi:hypothetical protein